MINKKFISYILLTALGFLAIIAVGLFTFDNLRGLTINYYNDLYEEYVTHLQKHHPTDKSYLDEFTQPELHLMKNEAVLMAKIRNTIVISVIIIIVFMGYQIWLSTKTTMVSSKELESDKRTRLMLNATPLMCSLWDIEGNLIDCNRETLKLIGLSKESDYIENFYKINPEYQPNGESTRSAVMRIAKETLETGYNRVEWMTRTVSGEPVPVETTIVRVPWKNSYRFAVYSRDLREEKAKEEAAKESEDRLRAMLDTMAIPCFFFDADGNVLECNQQTVNLFGFKEKKDFLDGFYDLSPEYQSDGKQSREKVKKIIQHTFETGEKRIFSWDHIKSDGTPLPVEIQVTRVEWKNGYRGVAYVRDLSELMEREETLKRVAALVEASPNMTMFLGADGIIRYMNPAASNLSGFSHDELQKDGLALIFSSGDFERINRVYINAAVKKLMTTFEMTINTRNGGKREISFSGIPVQLSDGSSGVGLIGRDITELKLMQRDFEVAKDQAERALASEVQYNKAKGDFLSRVSHELRTPLNAIIGVTNMARNFKKDKRLNQCCTQICDASEYLLGLVNDILDMTGFDTDNFSFVPKPFSLNKMMDSVIDHVTQMAKAKEQTFSADIDSGIQDWVESDERRLKQVLMNLLSNAIKFTPEKGTIKLSARMLEKNNGNCSIRFDVSDNGIGISKEALDRLWQVFEQADNSINREHGGMGLGLPLAKRIVNLMQGELMIKSELGKGSCFTCYVQLGVAREAEAVDVTNEANTASGDSLLTSDLGEKRILIVDDVSINRDILFALLEDTGMILDGACNGEEAVNMCLQNKYDLILMDLHMPVMDGYTATRNIRMLAQPWAKSVPIISISADTGAERISKCLEAGMNEHLPKPVEVEALFGTISKWMPKTATERKTAA